MVAFGHAEPTQTAVFGAGRLREGARWTIVPWPEEDVVVGIVPKPSGVVRRRDIMGRGGDAEVGEDVRQGQEDRDGQLETEGQVRQAVPDKRASAGAQQGQEDDLQRYEWKDRGGGSIEWNAPGRRDSSRRKGTAPAACSWPSLCHR